MNQIHIAFYLGKKKENPEARFLDQLICAVTGSRYSHVELVYDYNPYDRFGQCYSSSPREGGIRPQLIDFNTGHWEVFTFSTDLSKSEINKWFTQRLDCKYDWFGAVGARFPFVKEEPSRWFCSEAVATCLNLPNPHSLSPQELFELIVEKEGTTRII